MLLQRLARNVQREIVRVDHAPHKVQVPGQELVKLIRDQHLAHVELEPSALVAEVVEHARGRHLGHVQDGTELHLTLGLEVDPGGRVAVRVLRYCLVERLVFLVGDVLPFARPDGHHVVHPLPVVHGDRLHGHLLLVLVVLHLEPVVVLLVVLVAVPALLVHVLVLVLVKVHLALLRVRLPEVDGEGDELRVPRDELLQPRVREEGPGVLLQEKGDLSAAAQRVPAGVPGHREVGVRRGLPEVLVVIVVLGHYLHFVSHKVD
mmetsp:Transcript_35524/g.55843  ORF Transcript_35524/g.55843 Transcript_35524/m.55843 type:complete len:262 (-) Transcript_35524:633-1418(-)